MKINSQIKTGLHRAALPTMLSLMSAVTMAQEGQLSVLEEVIVTAQKRTESLQDTSISVVAFGAEQLERLDVNQVHEISLFTPNLAVHKNAGNTSSAGYFIRGIGQGDPGLAVDPTVGLYIDGVYIGRGNASAFDVVDLERIEVLRGPQGTLYGRNTTGGAINVISAKPTGELGFMQEVSVGNRDYWRSHTRVNLPEMGGVRAQLTYLASEDGANVDNHYPGGEDLGWRENRAYRLALGWSSDNLSIDYAYDNTEIEGTEDAFQLSFVDPTHVSIGGSQYADAMANASSGRLGSLTLDAIGVRDTNIDGHNLTVEWRGEQLSVKSITGYREFDERGRGTDLDGGAYISRGDAVTFVAPIPPGDPVSLFNASIENEHEQFSQEFQLQGSFPEQGLDFTIGAYYFEEQADESNPQANALPSLFLGGAFGQTTQLSTPLYHYTTDNSSTALYGQARWRPDVLERRLELTLGLRYTEDEREATIEHSNLQRLGIAMLEADENWSNVNPAFTVGYQVNDDVNVYARFATAYKSGGFNARAADPDLFVEPFDEEEVESYEIGLKSELFDRRLRLNAAVFYTDFEDMQIQQFRAGQFGATSVAVNAGSTEISGLELDLNAVLAEGLLLNASYGYLDTEINEYLYTDAQGNTSDQADDANLTIAPEHSVALGLQYSFAATDWGQPVISVDWAYKDDFYFSPLSSAFNGAAEASKAESYSVLNARLALNDIPLGGGTLRLALWGKNLNDEEYRVAGIDFGGLGYAGNAYAEMRSYGVDLRYDFE